MPTSMKQRRLAARSEQKQKREGGQRYLGKSAKGPSTSPEEK